MSQTPIQRIPEKQLGKFAEFVEEFGGDDYYNEFNRKIGNFPVKRTRQSKL